MGTQNQFIESYEDVLNGVRCIEAANASVPPSKGLVMAVVRSSG